MNNVKRKPMTKKIFSLTLGALLLALCFPAKAQQANKVPRIGYLSPGDAASESTRSEAIRLGAMWMLGYVEGQNIGSWEVRGADSFKEVFAALNRESPSGLYVTVGPLILSNGKQIADFATKGKLPSIQTSRAGIDAGGLMYRGDGSQSKLFSLLYPPNE
jgi:hypothetical protein